MVWWWFIYIEIIWCRWNKTRGLKMFKLQTGREFCLGVPRGFLLGLHLFLTCISDIPDGQTSKYKIFVGDISLQKFLILIIPGKNWILTYWISEFWDLASEHSYWKCSLILTPRRNGMRLNFLENLTHKCSYQKNLKKVNLENKLEKKKKHCKA